MELLLWLAVVGGGLLWWNRSRTQDATRNNQELIRNGQNLLAFFRRNDGVDISGRNQEQNALVRQFQITWNQFRDVEGIYLRTDGVWDSQTNEAFKRLTGFTPMQKQMQVTSGWVKG